MEAKMTQPHPIVIIGPPAGGKTTLAYGLAERDDRFQLVKTLTTRPQREGEKKSTTETDPSWSHDPHWSLMAIRDADGVKYGLDKYMVGSILRAGHYPVIVLDQAGAREVRERWTDTIVIWVEPANPAELCTRLVRRGYSKEKINAICDEFWCYGVDPAREDDFTVTSDTIDYAVDRAINQIGLIHTGRAVRDADHKPTEGKPDTTRARTPGGLLVVLDARIRSHAWMGLENVEDNGDKMWMTERMTDGRVMDLTDLERVSMVLGVRPSELLDPIRVEE